MQQPVKPRPADRESWAPNRYITESGNRFPINTLTNTNNRTAAAHTTLALLKAGAHVPPAYW